MQSRSPLDSYSHGLGQDKTSSCGIRIRCRTNEGFQTWTRSLDARLLWPVRCCHACCCEVRVAPRAVTQTLLSEPRGAASSFQKTHILSTKPSNRATRGLSSVSGTNCSPAVKRSLCSSSIPRISVHYRDHERQDLSWDPLDATRENKVKASALARSRRRISFSRDIRGRTLS